MSEKYGVGKAYYFIGFVEGNNDLYGSLQSSGFTLIFKPTFKDRDGKVKGNCDAELVLQAMIDLNKYEKAIIVTGDGDFYCLVDYLRKNDKLLNIMIPDKNSFSSLFRKLMPHIVFMNNLRDKLEYSKESK